MVTYLRVIGGGLMRCVIVVVVEVFDHGFDTLRGGLATSSAAHDRMLVTVLSCSIAQLPFRIYQVVPGAGAVLIDDADWMCPTSGATCTEPRLAAT